MRTNDLLTTHCSSHSKVVKIEYKEQMRKYRSIIYGQKLSNVKRSNFEAEQLGLNSGIKLVKSSELYCRTGHFGLNSDPIMELCIHGKKRV